MWAVLIPVTLVTFKNQDELSTNKDLKRKFEGYFEDLRTDSFWALMYTPIFIIRRLIFCILLLTSPTQQLSQVVIFILSTFLYIFYLAMVQPFEERISNIMSIVNESFVFVMSLLLLTFVDVVCCEDPRTQVNTGWFIIFWINLICGINMIIALIDTVKGIISAVKKCCKKCKQKAHSDEE